MCRKALGGLLGAAALGFVGTAAPAEPPAAAHVIEDPHYGDVLFEFYQHHDFAALTRLMVSQHFGRMPRHGDEAELLRGGLLLSYGLHDEAGRIFTQLIDANAAPSVRDRAWFFLAKIRYQRGFFADAERALDKVGTALPPALDDDRKLLKANLLMARGDHAGAATVLDAMRRDAKDGSRSLASLLSIVSPRSWWSPAPDGAGDALAYARFNLGVALVKSGDTARGNALLDEAGQAPAATEELRSLRDKANLALGFAALQSGAPAAARASLERVRLDGLQANKALLGFGWAADALKQPKLALVPWTELAGRDPGDAAVLEARLAVPHAFAELGADRQALEHYTAAIAAFERESRQLDTSIAAVRDGRVLDALVARNPGQEMGWFWPIRQLPTDIAHAQQLAPLFAQHAFQEGFKNYRDLLFLARNLQQWRDTLGVFDDMVANRRAAFSERLPQVRAQAEAQAGADGLPGLQRRRDALAAELQQAMSANDGLAFADAGEQALLARLAAVRATLQTAPADAADAADAPSAEDIALARERARRVEGAMTWRLAQQAPARLWDAQKGLRAVDAALARAQAGVDALAQAQRDEPARFDAFATRTSALGARIDVLLPRVAQLADVQRAEIESLAVAELQQQQQRLAAYANQARFAVAQLYDRAASADAGRTTTVGAAAGAKP